MNRCLRVLVSVGICLSAVSASANAPPPPPREPQTVVGKATLPIEIVRKQKLEGERVFAKLVIPKGMKIGGLRVEDAPQLAAEERSDAAPLRTIVAGLAFSLAAVGLVFAFRGGRNTKIAAAAVLFAAGLAVTWTAARADISPPFGGPRPRPRPAPVEPGKEVRTLLIEVQEIDSDRATLYLSE